MKVRGKKVRLKIIGLHCRLDVHTGLDWIKFKETLSPFGIHCTLSTTSFHPCKLYMWTNSLESEQCQPASQEQVDLLRVALNSS